MDAQRFDQATRALARRALLTGAVGLLAAPMAGRAATRATCRAAGQGCTRSTQCCSGACAVGKTLPRSQRNRCPGSCDTSTAFICGVDIAGARVEAPGPCGVFYPSLCTANADCRDILVDRDPDGPLSEGWDGYTFSCLVEGWYNGRQIPTITRDRTFCFATNAGVCTAIAP